MSTPSEVIPIRGKKFTVPVHVRDQKTGDEYTVNCEIDTGSPDSLLLPREYEALFEVFMGRVDRSGAGMENSPTYAVEIFGIGDLRFSFEDLAVMALQYDPYRNYTEQIGLIGTDFLRYCDSEIGGNPAKKTFEMWPNHI